MDPPRTPRPTPIVFHNGLEIEVIEQPEKIEVYSRPIYCIGLSLASGIVVENDGQTAREVEYQPGQMNIREPGEWKATEYQQNGEKFIAVRFGGDLSNNEKMKLWGSSNDQRDEVAAHIIKALARLDPEHDDPILIEYLTTALTWRATGWFDKKQDNRSGERLARVIDYINDNLSQRMTLTELSNVAHMSTYHFCRVFRRETGMAPHHYVQQKRVELARRLLSDKRIPLASVAIACGFSSQAHFTKVFRAFMGTTPRRYRMQALKLSIAAAGSDHLLDLMLMLAAI